MSNLVDKFPIATVSLIFLAAGCSVGPNYQKPDLPVPAAWTEAQQKGVDARAIELTRWWTKFNDPLLDSLVERAAKSNLDLRLAEARIREARASRAVTASGAWPTVDVSGSYTRNRSSENAIGLPAQGAVVSALWWRSQSRSEPLPQRFRRQLGNRCVWRRAPER